MGGVVDHFTCERYIEDMRILGQLGAVYKNGKVKVIFLKKPSSVRFATLFCGGGFPGSIYKLMREKNGLSLKYVAKKLKLTEKLIKKIEVAENILYLLQKDKILKLKVTQEFLEEYFACVNKLKYSIVKQEHERARL